MQSMTVIETAPTRQADMIMEAGLAQEQTANRLRGGRGDDCCSTGGCDCCEVFCCAFQGAVRSVFCVVTLGITELTVATCYHFKAQPYKQTWVGMLNDRANAPANDVDNAPKA